MHLNLLVKGAIALGKKIVKVWIMMMKKGIFVGHPFLALPPSTLPQLPLPHFLLHLHSPRSPSPRSALAPLAPVNPTWRPCGPRSSAGLEALQAWRPFGLICPAVLEALQAWMPWGPGCPSGLEALRVWRPCRPGVTASLESLQAWRPCYPFGSES